MLQLYLTTTGIVLTEDGKFFLEQMQVINDTLDEIKNHFVLKLDANRNIKDTIYFLAPFSFNNNFFSMAIEHFYNEYPNIEIIYRQNNNNNVLLEKVNNDRNTIGILPIVSTRNTDFLNQYQNIEYATLFRETPVLVVSDKNKFINPHQKQISLSSLLKIPLAVISSESKYESYISESAFKSFNYEPAKIIAASNTLIYYNYINRGDCIGITAKDNVNEVFLKEFPNIKAISIKDNFFFNYYIVINKQAEIPMAIKLFYTYLFDNRKNYPIWTQNTRSLNFAGFENPHAKKDTKHN